MAATYILSIDQGTTGSTVVIVDVSDPLRMQVIGNATVDFPQHYPQSGWVEHNLEEIWRSVCTAAERAIAMAAVRSEFSVHKIAAIGITNQRETLCAFDRRTSVPYAPAIVWQCRRSTDICARFKSQGLEPTVKLQTGLVLDPYFSGTKITWLMENNPGLAEKVRNGQAILGTIDSYLLHRLTCGQVFATEASNASRTLLVDLKTGKYSDPLLEMFKVPNKDALPEIKNSAGVFGRTKRVDFLPDGIPISGILGDQQAALAGQACYDVGEAKCTYGTGAFLLLNIGDQVRHSQCGLLTTIAWNLNGKITYAFEGSAFIAGAAMQFLRDQLHMIQSAGESAAMAADVIAAPEIYFVPALAGLGAPYWDPRARGAFFGLTRGTTSQQIVRASLEGIAFQVWDLAQAIQRDFPEGMKVLRADGGAAANDLLMQTQANLMQLPVDRPKDLDTTAFGAALFAGLGIGIYANLQELGNARAVDRVFTPDRTPTATSLAHQQLSGWQRAVRAVRLFADSNA